MNKTLLLSFVIGCGLAGFGCGDDDDDDSNGGDLEIGDYCTYFCECTANACFDGESGAFEECLEECEFEMPAIEAEVEEHGCYDQGEDFLECLAEHVDSCECDDDGGFAPACGFFENELEECLN
jgi:hypothetical protein